ncbi:hypothetical protein PRIPAC_82300 [Pristionchus pacificus]|uniref:Uncharacterized protein n=1 Tax=Pristionchus pacificus TaxID=54126 RepID=A0A2A6BXJ5_PRIPA|nr:hypothetical protein PRIPAC_82300 [Pristionchus pacificus]|eukprot:PDM70608.1 hypothetical protein PRIPAC_46854 [Pristionchus pacificus]
MGGTTSGSETNHEKNQPAHLKSIMVMIILQILSLEAQLALLTRQLGMVMAAGGIQQQYAGSGAGSQVRMECVKHWEG